MVYIQKFENFESLDSRIREKLLSIGGTSIKDTFEEDAEKLLTRGIHFQPEDIDCLNMEQSRCHRNTSYVWKGNKQFKIVTGWALHNDIWYQHTWLYREDDNEIVETTPTIYDEYFGFILKEEESKEFYWNNN